jgi:hypothetical protein
MLPGLFKDPCEGLLGLTTAITTLLFRFLVSALESTDFVEDNSLYSEASDYTELLP